MSCARSGSPGLSPSWPPLSLSMSKLPHSSPRTPRMHHPWFLFPPHPHTLAHLMALVSSRGSPTPLLLKETHFSLPLLFGCTETSMADPGSFRSPRVSSFEPQRLSCGSDSHRTDLFFPLCRLADSSTMALLSPFVLSGCASMWCVSRQRTGYWRVTSWG